MSILTIVMFLVAFFTVGQARSAVADSSPKKTPNVVIILADDLGYSDLGCFGSEIETPHLDQLAENGLRFTQFYNTSRCWPSRGALMTGYYAQQIRRDAIPGTKVGQRPAWARLLPDFLKTAGYRSYHSGKWHIDGNILPAGFDRSYMLNDHDRLFYPNDHKEDDGKLPATPLDGPGYYVTTSIADHAVNYLKQHAQSHKEKPFFLYAAFTAPHFPLKAPQEDIDRYRDRYLSGWDQLRQERYEKMTSMGLINTPLSPMEPDVGPPYDFPEAIAQLGPGEINRPAAWDSLTDEQKIFQATKMAIHAAMVDRMDQEIGKLLDQIRTMNAWDDTLIFFLSDNGASAEIMIRGDGHDPQAAPGSEASYLCLGPGFSSAANTPFRRHKTWVHEGGISTSLIAHWPNGIKAHGELRHTPGHVVDLVPTILEAANLQKPSQWDGIDIPAAPGKSLVSVFEKDSDLKRESLWWLHEGNRAVRVGDWKLVAVRGGQWELYDLSKDRAETQNLAGKHPDKVKELAAIWQAQLDHCQTLVGSAPQ